LDITDKPNGQFLFLFQAGVILQALPEVFLRPLLLFVERRDDPDGSLVSLLDTPLQI